MKQILKTFSIIFLSSIIMVISSCKKEIDGCTDSSAMNYSADATTNDGSCIFAYDIAQGIWNILPDCEEYTIPIINQTLSLNDQLPESIEVQGAGDNSTLYIDINGTQVNGVIDFQGNIIVPEQTIEIDMGFGPMDIDVEGSGLIDAENSGNMDLTYSFDIEAIPGFPMSESLDCSILLTR